MTNRFSRRRRFKQGCTLLRSGSWSEAEQLFRAAVAEDPDDSASLHNLGIALLKQERWEEAATSSLRALRLKPDDPEPHETFAIALLKMARWEEAAFACRRATERHPGVVTLFEQLGIALSKRGHWEGAADALRQAAALAPDQAGLHRTLGTAYMRLCRWQEAEVALRRALEVDPYDQQAHSFLDTVLVEAAAIRETAAVPASGQTNGPEPVTEETPATPPGGDVPPPEAIASEPVDAQAAAARAKEPSQTDSGLQMLAEGQWAEAVEKLQEGVSILEFLTVDPLVRMGRFEEGAEAYRRAVALGKVRPLLQGEPGAERFAHRRTSFWTPENLGPDVFRLEGWLKELAAGPGDREESRQRAPRLMFVLDNDYGEMTTLMYLALGRQLINDITLVLPARLYADNATTLPRRTHRYGSIEDVERLVEDKEPDIVFLCSAYLFAIHKLLTLEELERLMGFLRDRGCRVVTSDPFLGLLSQGDPRDLVAIRIPDREVEAYSMERLLETKAVEDERLWTSFTRCSELLADVEHLYPTYCDIPEDEFTPSDRRNIACYNPSLVVDRVAALESPTTGTTPDGKPLWLFVISATDFDTQELFVGRTPFVELVATKLVETLAAGRHPVVLAPRRLINLLENRLPTAEGIDLLYYCPFPKFIPLVLSAEYAFYWNVLSHSILIRLFNGLPTVVFDKGHLVRNIPSLYRRVVQWYYQGWEPTLSDHWESLSVDVARRETERYRAAADDIIARFKRAPSPEEMIDRLGMGR